MAPFTRYELHVICQTHWDREWRVPFQQARLMLVDMMDHLLELMQCDPALRYYHLDGQTILLEDYLEIRPEQRSALAALIAEGRLLVGPWYTLPEENLVAGECLIRNLLMGHCVARSLGAVMKVGFTPASYGQVAQMPQILAGFKIDTILFHRGVPAHEVDIEYVWEGSDGSRLLALRPPLGGRFNFTTLVTNMLSTSPEGGRMPYCEVSAQDLACSIGVKTAGNESDVYYSTRVPRAWNRAALRKAVERLKSLAATRATTPHLYCGEGHDWMEANPLVPAIVAEAGSLLPNDTILISSLPEMIARIKGALSGPAVLKGEMRSAQKDEAGARLYAHTLSCRMPIKQMNRRVEDALIRWAEPFSTVAWSLGAAYPEALMRQAWRYLLANHAHDSITGTGVDQVHNDVMARFTQCELMAGELTRKALSHIVARVDDRRVAGNDALLTIFNPLPFARDEVIRLDLDLPETDPPGFRLYDPEGNEVPCHPDAPLKIIHTVQQTHGFPYRLSAVRHPLWIRARSIPALGCATYIVRRGAGPRQPSETSEDDDRVVITGPNRMENRCVAVAFNGNGTLSIEDKRTGRRYEDLHEFEDVGEIGEGYEHRQPPNGTVVTSRHGEASIEVVHHNALTATFRVRLCLNVPESASADKGTRVSRTNPCEVSSLVTLTAGSGTVGIVTRVNNTSRDHRLRVLFPTRLRTDECWAETQCDVQRRTVGAPRPEGWIEAPPPTQPQLTFVDLSDGDAGFAVINHGLPEYEVIADDHRTIALTLLRCFTHQTRATRTDDPTQVGTQCLGVHEFKYALLPHEGDWHRGRVFTEAYRYLHRPKVVQSWRNVDSTEGREDSGEGPPSFPSRPSVNEWRERPSEPLPLRASFLQLLPDDLVLSAVKRSESGDRMVVRFFNPTDRRIEGRLRVYHGLAGAQYLDLEEDPLGECPAVGDHEVRIVAGPKKIVTVGLDLA
jgi:mannosylglycerate hydrolase